MSVAAFEDAEFIRSLSAKGRRWARERAQSRLFYPKRRLFSKGEPASHFWAIERGSVRLFEINAKGQVTTLETLGPGQMFGLWSVAVDESYAAHAEGISEGRVWRLEKTEIERLIEDQPVLAQEMVQIIADRLRDAHERLHSFAHDGVPARLARALLRAADGDAARVTRRILAEDSGTTVETTIRIMRRFEREGLVRGQVGAIHIIDAPKLAAIAEGLPEG